MNSNDYQAWNELMAGRGRVMQVINEDNFARFVEARELVHNGDLEGADEIRKELGLRTRGGEKVGAEFGGRQGKMSAENRGHNNLR